MIWHPTGQVGNSPRQTRRSLMGRNSRQHQTCSQRVAFTKGKIESMTSQLWMAKLSALLCISLCWCFSSSSWWSVNTEYDNEEIAHHTSSRIKGHCDTQSDLRVEPFSFTIVYVDCDIAGKCVGENNTQIFSQHWPGDDQMIWPFCQLCILPPLVCQTLARKS